MPVIRPLRLDDAEPLAALAVANRVFLAPSEPERPERFFTVDGQHERIAASLEAARAGTLHRFAILDDDRSVAGVVSLEHVIRFAAQSATVGYWVDRDRNGRGLATRAVRAVLGEAFGPLGLHRMQTGTLVDNAASQRVLHKNGFERIGLARGFLFVGGAWRDHVLFQRLAA